MIAVHLAGRHERVPTDGLSGGVRLPGQVKGQFRSEVGSGQGREGQVRAGHVRW